MVQSRRSEDVASVFYSQHIDQLSSYYLFHLVLIRHEFQSLTFKINFPHGKICEKSISNDCIFAIKKNQIEKQFSDFKSVTQTVTQSVIQEVEKIKKYYFFKIQNPLKQNFKRAK